MAWVPSPECLAPFGDPVVPEVSRIVFDVRGVGSGRQSLCL